MGAVTSVARAAMTVGCSPSAIDHVDERTGAVVFADPERRTVYLVEGGWAHRPATAEKPPEPAPVTAGDEGGDDGEAAVTAADLPAGARDLIAFIGGDADRAAVALEAEKARDLSAQRKTVLDHIEDVLGDEGGDDGEAAAAG